MITIKRVYDPAEPKDGYRVLVDRLWPRGLTKEDAAVDAWLKDVAPSAELRRWFGHEPSRWPGFQDRYRKELAAPALAPLLTDLRARARSGRVTLLFAAKNALENNACVLRDVLLKRR